jgi:ribonuclease T2
MNGPTFRKFLAAYLFLALAVSGFAKHHKTDNTPGQFDYYLFTLSWAPEFCATHPDNKSSSECDPKRHLGLVVHGLWPQNDNNTYPQSCAPAQPVASDIVREMLPYVPTRQLIQHEWEKHGTCSGLPTQDYFGAIKKLYTGLKVPEKYQQPSANFQASPGDIEQAFADANSAPRNAFRVSCSSGQFVAFEVCYDKNFQYRDCGSLKECPADHVQVRHTP